MFTHEVLGRHQVDYFECESCASLQTEKPHWLDEAYAIPGVHVDVGQAARVVQTWARLCFLLETIGFDKQRECIDYGGSAGLLTRLMRDSGFKYLAYDAYDDSKYANYFKINRLDDISPGLVTAFEVFEHFPQPAESIGELFAIKPDLIVFSTVFYEGQGPEWEYLVPYCGQHIFFYREQALRAFGERHGYALRRSQDFWLMIRETSPYLATFDAKHNAAMDAAFVGELFLRVGHGTEQTLRDYSYAKDRFISELGTARSATAKPKNWLRRLLGLA
jgi:hypothetical protein